MRNRLFLSLAACMAVGFLALLIYPSIVSAWNPYGLGHRGMAKELTQASGLWYDNQSVAKEFKNRSSWADSDYPDNNDGTWGIDDERDDGGGMCSWFEGWTSADCDHFYNVDKNGGEGDAHLDARRFIGYWGKWYMDYGYTDAGLKSIGRGMHYIQDMSQPQHVEAQVNDDWSCQDWFDSDHYEFEAWASFQGDPDHWDSYNFDYYTWLGAYGTPSMTINSNADIETETANLAERSDKIAFSGPADCGWDNEIGIYQDRFEDAGEVMRAAVNYAAPSYFK